jgi:hypothetical protein
VFFPCWAPNSLLGPACRFPAVHGVPARTGRRAQQGIFKSGPAAGNSGRSEGLLPAGPSKEFRAQQQGENTNPPKSLSSQSCQPQPPCTATIGAATRAGLDGGGQEEAPRSRPAGRPAWVDMLGVEVGYRGRGFSGWHRQAPEAERRQPSAQATLEQLLLQHCLRLGAGADAGGDNGRGGAVQAEVRLNALTDVASAKGAHVRRQLVFFRATPAALEAAAAAAQAAVVKGEGAEAEAAGVGAEGRGGDGGGGDGPVLLGPLRPLPGWPHAARLRVCYYIAQGGGGGPLPALAPFCWYVRQPLRLGVLRGALGVLMPHDARWGEVSGTVL